MKELPDSMMEALRGRRGLNKDDTSSDEEILEMSPTEIVLECAAWHLGDGYWAVLIAAWIDAAGADVKDVAKPR